MIAWWRPGGLPAGLREAVERDGIPGRPGERPLASAELTDGGIAAATTHRLLTALPGQPATADLWTDIVSAGLEPDEGVLEIDLAQGGHRVLVLGPGRGRRLAGVVRERVQHSILLTRSVDLPGDRTVRVSARRDPGGQPFIQLVPAPGAGSAPADPAQAAAVAHAVRAVREQVGLPADP